MSEPHRVASRVRLKNLTEARTAGERYIDTVDADPCIDFRDLVKSNSATVALLMALYRHAQAQRKAITFMNVPKDMRDIIDLSGLTDVLPIADAPQSDGAPTDL